MNAELSFEEWQTIRASVEREYRRAYSQTGFTQGLVSAVLNGKRNHHKGYTFRYEAEVIGNIHENKYLLEAKNVD